MNAAREAEWGAAGWLAGAATSAVAGGRGCRLRGLARTRRRFGVSSVGCPDPRSRRSMGSRWNPAQMEIGSHDTPNFMQPLSH